MWPGCRCLGCVGLVCVVCVCFGLCLRLWLPCFVLCACIVCLGVRFVLVVFEMSVCSVVLCDASENVLHLCPNVSIVCVRALLE